MKQHRIQNNLKVNDYLSEWKTKHKFIEAGQLRRTKMHAARLIDTIENMKVASLTLHQLLEASIILETTDPNILAAYLKRSPAIIRAEFQRIRTVLGEFQKNS